MIQYEIKPYIGVGPLNFEMSKKDVIAILGEPDFFDTDDCTNILVGYWEENGLQLSFEAQTENLVSISLYSNIKNIQLGLLKLDWKKSQKFYQELIQKDSSVKKTAGITIFFDHGISVTGFMGDEDGNKSLSVFKNGLWVEAAL